MTCDGARDVPLPDGAARDDLSVTGLRVALDDRLRRIRGVAVSRSMFGDRDAYWCNGKEIAHFERGSALEIRLTKAEIRDRRERLKTDPRVLLRPSGADWMTVQPTSTADIRFVVELVRIAVKAHRPAPGDRLRPPPTGPELDRRRRFH